MEMDRKGSKTRVFKNKWFSRFARKEGIALADEMLGYDDATLTKSLKNGAIVEVICNEKTVSE